MPKVNGVPINELCGYLGASRPERAFAMFG